LHGFVLNGSMVVLIQYYPASTCSLIRTFVGLSWLKVANAAKSSKANQISTTYNDTQHKKIADNHQGHLLFHLTYFKTLNVSLYRQS